MYATAMYPKFVCRLLRLLCHWAREGLLFVEPLSLQIFDCIAHLPTSVTILPLSLPVPSLFFYLPYKASVHAPLFQDKRRPAALPPIYLLPSPCLPFSSSFFLSKQRNPKAGASEELGRASCYPNQLSTTYISIYYPSKHTITNLSICHLNITATSRQVSSPDRFLHLLIRRAASFTRHFARLGHVMFSSLASAPAASSQARPPPILNGFYAFRIA